MMFSKSSNAALQTARDAPSATLGEHLRARLERLMHALGQSAHLPHALPAAELLAASWSAWPAQPGSPPPAAAPASAPSGAVERLPGSATQSPAAQQSSPAQSSPAPHPPGPAWPSDITDDHTPFELSLSFDGSAEWVRILTEPQDPSAPSLLASWRAAAAIHEVLAQRRLASFERYETIADLFAPSAAASARFSAWHSAVASRGADPTFKIYLNPAIHGTEDASALLQAALARLGLSAIWSDFARQTFTRGALDAPLYVSLDLVAGPSARVKIYMAHHAATSAALTRLLASSAGFHPESIQRWCRDLMGGPGPYEQRPPITCFALRPGSVELHSTTLHLPVRCYLPDDFETARRISALLSFPQRVRYMRALTALSDRPLDAGRGLQTYASLRASPGKEAVTVYLAPQVYAAAGEALASSRA